MAHLRNAIQTHFISRWEFVVPLSLLGYAFTIVIFYPLVGSPLFSITVIPVTIICIFGGMKAGVLMGPTFLVLNWLLLVYLGAPYSFTMFVVMYGWINAVAISAVGIGIGYVVSLNKRLNKEIIGREQAQRSLDKLNQKLERQTQQALQARSHFLTAMSHKLRTPLNASVGMGTLLLDTKLDPVQSDYVHNLQRSNNEVTEIINSILEYTKAESGEIELNEIAFDLAELLDQLQYLVRPKADERRVKLDFSIDPSVEPQVVGDRKKLHIILNNLLNNALDATLDETVTLCVTLAQTAAQEMAPIAGNKMRLTFSIIDTGRGIAPEELVELFEPFGNSYQTTTHAGVGAGIGMALCHRLCHNMGGQITAKSILGEGTTITVTLPFEQAAAMTVSHIYRPALKPNLLATQPRVAGTQKILLAEDNILNAKVALKMLEKLGYSATWVQDGYEAVEAVASVPYDLVLMDIQMPRLDGLAATKAIRKKLTSGEQATHPLRIIAMTADTTLEDFSKQRAYGFDGFISKPVSIHVLDKALSDMLLSVSASSVQSLTNVALHTISEST